MYHLKYSVESFVWDNLQQMFEDLGEDNLVPSGEIINEDGTKDVFNNTFELLRSVKTRFDIGAKRIEFIIHNVDIESGKYIVSTTSYCYTKDIS